MALSHFPAITPSSPRCIHLATPTSLQALSEHQAFLTQYPMMLVPVPRNALSTFVSLKNIFQLLAFLHPKSHLFHKICSSIAIAPYQEEFILLLNIERVSSFFSWAFQSLCVALHFALEGKLLASRTFLLLPWLTLLFILGVHHYDLLAGESALTG